MKTDTKIIDSLTTGCQAWFKSQSTAERAQATADAQTDKILIPAIECGSLDSWDAHVKAVFTVARSATKSQRKAMGFEQETRKDKGGNNFLYTFPCKYLAVIFSTIRQTYARSLEFKDKSGTILSFHQLKLNKAADIGKVNKKAKGRKGDLVKLVELQKTQRARAKNYNDVDLHNFIERLSLEVADMPTTKTKAA